MDRPPTISLYIPAYNAEDTLGACLDAIARQTLSPDEIIVIDDGSTDGTVDVARRAGVTVIQQHRNGGVGQARNAAVGAASGDLLAAVDADLVPRRDFLARAVSNFTGVASIIASSRNGRNCPTGPSVLKWRRRIVGCCGRVEERYTATLADRWRSVHMKLHFGQRRSYQPRWLFGGFSMIDRRAIIGAGMFDERCLAAYEDVALSDALRRDHHTLLYDPGMVATHLKRSAPGDVVRGFWNYWAAKNEIDGAYATLEAARRLMVRRQMGIACFRIDRDVRRGRSELLVLDLLIPLAFCVRDLEHLTRHARLDATARDVLHAALVESCLDGAREHIPGGLPYEWASLAFADRSMPHGVPRALDAAAGRYVRTFDAGFRTILTEMSPRSRRRIAATLPALLREAGRRRNGDAFRTATRRTRKPCPL